MGLGKIENPIGLSPADFAHYRSTVVGRAIAESGFDFDEERRKVERVQLFIEFKRARSEGTSTMLSP